MLKSISKTFLTGLITILPVVLTLYFLYWLVVSAETALGGLIRLVLPENLYWLGMGSIAGLLGVFLVRLLMHAYVVQRLFAWSEQILYRVPVIKSVYRAIRDFFNYISLRTKRRSSSKSYPSPSETPVCKWSALYLRRYRKTCPKVFGKKTASWFICRWVTWLAGMQFWYRAAQCVHWI